MCTAAATTTTSAAATAARAAATASAAAAADEKQTNQRGIVKSRCIVVFGSNPGRSRTLLCALPGC